MVSVTQELLEVVSVRRMTPKVLIYAKPLLVSPNPNPLLTPLEGAGNLGGLGGP